MTYRISRHKCESDGKLSIIEGDQVVARYRIVDSSDAAIVIATSAEGEKESFDVLHFEGENRFWLYYPGSAPDFDDHTRVFYVRDR